MAVGIIETGILEGTISDSNQLTGQIEQNHILHGRIGSTEKGTLTAIISDSSQLAGQIEQGQSLYGQLGLPNIVYSGDDYKAGTGIIIDHRIISLDKLIIDCGVGTT